MTSSGYVIRERRLALGLTQDQAAKRAGLDRSQFNQIERGRRGVGAEVAARLAAALGGTPDEYVSGPPVSVNAAEVILARMDEMEETIGRALARLQGASPTDLAEILVRRLDEGEDVPLEVLERAAAQLDETAALCARLAGRLRRDDEAASSRP